MTNYTGFEPCDPNTRLTAQSLQVYGHQQGMTGGNTSYSTPTPSEADDMESPSGEKLSQGQHIQQQPQMMDIAQQQQQQQYWLQNPYNQQPIQPVMVPVFYPAHMGMDGMQGVQNGFNGYGYDNGYAMNNSYNNGYQNQMGTPQMGSQQLRGGRWGRPNVHGNHQRAAASSQEVEQLKQAVQRKSRDTVQHQQMGTDRSNQGEDAVDPMMLELENDNVDTRRREVVLERIAESFWPLALNKRGCRILQKAIEVGSPEYQQKLAEQLRGQVHQGIQSPHANYVLQKVIQVLPPKDYLFMLDEIQKHVLYVVRHRFGCRILQRLLEHCTAEQLEPMMNKVVQDTTSLIRHQYGNFVLQHILQYGTPAQRHVIAEVVYSDMIRLAKHRLGSHVVSCALNYCSSEDVGRLTGLVLSDPKQLAELSHREYGSFVVREVNRAARLLKQDREGQ